MIKRVNPPSLARPSGFAHAVRATSGTMVFLAGQTALASGGTIVGTTVADQFEQALGNLLTALRAAGGGPEHLASLTIYAVDLADYRAHAREIGAAWRPRLPRDGRRRRHPALGPRSARGDPGLCGHPLTNWPVAAGRPVMAATWACAGAARTACSAVKVSAARRPRQSGGSSSG